MEMVDWSDGWQGDLRDKVNGKQGCKITDKHGKVLLGQRSEHWDRAPMRHGLRCKHRSPTQSLYDPGLVDSGHNVWPIVIHQQL